MKAPRDLVKVDLEEEDFDDFDGRQLCLNTKAACKLLGVGRTKFWQIAASLPSVNLTGRRFWCRKGIERWVAANTLDPQDPHNA